MIKNFTVPASSSKPGDETNAVQVSVSYRKGRGFVASAYPARLKDGIVSISLSLLCGTPTIVLAPASRDNKKQQAIWEQTAENHIELRKGAIWDLVLRACAENRLEPLPKAETATT